MNDEDQEQILGSNMSESKMSSKKGKSPRSRFEDRSQMEGEGSDEEEDEDGSDMSDSDCIIRGEDMIVSTFQV